MSLAVDETAGDLPVRDVGLRDRRRVFRASREQLEEQCLRLQKENTLLRQHTRTQDQRLRRMSTKLLCLRERHPGTSALREGELEDTVQELEARVATLESQKGALQSKLGLARQHILNLGERAHYRARGRGQDEEDGVRRATQTALPRYGLNNLENTREEIERIRCNVIEMQQVKVTELELAAQSLRDTLREEREIEDTMREQRRQQADGQRVTLRENVDLIRLQKQLSDKSAALLVIQEKFNVLQEVYEEQLAESQKPLKENQEVLLEKIEKLIEQLKQERQIALCLERQLTTATISTQALEELQERLSDVEGERALLKESYDKLIESTLSSQSQRDKQDSREKEKERGIEESWRKEVQGLEETLELEREERGRLEEEKERMQQERQREREREQMEKERETSESLREKHNSLEQEVLQYRGEVTSLQERLDSVTKAVCSVARAHFRQYSQSSDKIPRSVVEFNMSVEDLSETLLQIKAFRLQQEGEKKLVFFGDDGKVEGYSKELTSLQASHTETVLELQKSRDMLLLQHRINTDLQTEIKTVMEGFETEKESRKRMVEKDRLLEKRAQRITTLQAQLKELAYSPKKNKRTVPPQHTWAGGDREVAEPAEDDTIYSQLSGGESLLEIHLRGAAFTPGGLRALAQDRAVVGDGVKGHEVVTFCTYYLLDFETHSTPLVTGPQPNYGFTSCYPLSPQDLGEVRGQGGGIRVEVHQALGGVQFVTRGLAWISLSGAEERMEERLTGKANITGSEGEILGLLEFWVRLYPPAELTNTLTDRRLERLTDRWTSQLEPSLHPVTLEESVREGLSDHGGGIPNELEVVLERCVGLSARWSGLLPDTYLLYRLYDLPPHASPTIPCSADPVFGDAVCYPLAITTDVMAYLQGSSLWVYAFDDSDHQTPTSYLAKSPIPLRALALGRPIRGDYVLRDAGGCPHGMVRVSLRWKYPFQPPEALQSGRESNLHRRRERTETQERLITKPRSKAAVPKLETHAVHRETQTQPPSIRLRRSQTATPLKHCEPHKNTPSHPSPHPPPAPATHLQPPATKRAALCGATALWSSAREWNTPRPPSTPPTRTPITDPKTLEVQSPGQEVERLVVEDEHEEDGSEKAPLDSEDTESSESEASSGSDVLIIPHPPKAIKKGDRVRVEILSLSFHPSSCVALDQLVQCVYVEYRLLGVPMETTETPMSLRKPTAGEDIHYNFTRVIYVDSAEAAPLRQYLYTMLEGLDPNKGRLKFTIVSEPMDEEEECVDVGHAYLDLQEVLLTGNDVTERQIDIVGMCEEEELGKLKVSVEAAQALREIYWEQRGLREGTRGGAEKRK